MKVLLTYGIILFPFLLIFCLVLYNAIKSQDKQVAKRKALQKWHENAAKIRPGMSREEVFNLVGENCMRSFLQDNTEVYEWKIQQSGGSVTNHHQVGDHTVSVSQHYNGNEFSLKVTFKNDVVVEVIFGDHML